MNGETDHRCRRCGRRLLGTAVAAPAEFAERAVQALGANALAAAHSTLAAELPRKAPVPQAASEAPEQAPLFAKPQPKLVTMQSTRSEMEETGVAKKPRTAPRRKLSEDFGNQTTLDFLPSAGPQKSRMLKTTVEAVVYCDAPVARPMQRAGAALVDFGMIALAAGLFAGIFAGFGGPVEWNKQNLALFGASLALISMFYGFVWMMAGRETLGMRLAELRILNFNGFPPDRKSRALRMIGCWLSVCSGFIGIAWALVDEESLTWHDHMSKTFPTLRESATGFIREK